MKKALITGATGQAVPTSRSFCWARGGPGSKPPRRLSAGAAARGAFSYDMSHAGGLTGLPNLHALPIAEVLHGDGEQVSVANVPSSLRG